MAILIYLATGVAAFFVARKAGVSRWLAIVLAWLGPIGLIGTLVAFYAAWRRGVPIVAEKAEAKPDDGKPPAGTQLAP